MGVLGHSSPEKCELCITFVTNGNDVKISLLAVCVQLAALKSDSAIDMNECRDYCHNYKHLHDCHTIQWLYMYTDK